MLPYLLAALGGAIGSVCRVAVGKFVTGQMGDAFPWGTLLVNVTGAFAIGFIATITAVDGRWAQSEASRQFLMAGLCGGYTTFSAFSLQTFELAQNGEWFRAGAYTISSVVVCVAGTALGHACATTMR